MKKFRVHHEMVYDIEASTREEAIKKAKSLYLLAVSKIDLVYQEGKILENA